jgi:ferric-dicitrate binding protein FerR (iron transport regulator)
MKNLEDDRNWLLITKYLSNELNEGEKTEFEEWLKVDSNRKELDHVQQIWHLSAQKEEQLFDNDNGWSKMDRRISGDPGNIQFTRKRLFISSVRIAASLLFLMTLAFAARYFISGNKFTKVSATEKMVASPVILPDNTKVYLNAGSTLIYPRKFGKKSRDIELKGEAFFDVARNEKLPFIIHTANAQIKVLGTSFNVYAYHDKDSIQVIVKTGVVELSDNNKTASIQLTKGTTGVYYSSLNQTKYTQPDINSLAWFSNSIVFKNSDIPYVVKTLEHVFGKNIEIGSDKILNCRLEANFKDQDLTKILESIKTSLNIEFKKTSDGYIITGPGC